MTYTYLLILLGSAVIGWLAYSYQRKTYRFQREPDLSPLSEKDSTLLESLGFSKELLENLPKNVNGRLSVIRASKNAFGPEVDEDGSWFALGLRMHYQCESFVQELLGFEGGQYLFFMSEVFTSDWPLYTLLISDDKLAPIRFIGVHSDSGLSTQNIYARMKEWDAEYGIDEVQEATEHSLEIKFKVLPKDRNQFFDEYRQFCPQTVADLVRIRESFVNTKVLQLNWS